MTFAVSVREDGTPVRWSTDGDGATAAADSDYEPSLLAAARGDDEATLDWLADALTDHEAVTAVDRVRRHRDLAAAHVGERSPFVRASLTGLDQVRGVARSVRRAVNRERAPGTVSLYDVDLDPGFRYCLDRGIDPTPDRELRTLRLTLPAPRLADDDPTGLRVDGERIGETPTAVREGVERALVERDPDVLVLSAGDLVPLLAALGVDLGRRPGYRKLAGENTFVSYGRVGHSPARYAVPGRAIVDASSSFLLGESGLAGLRYLVGASGKPLQELAADSIGGVLTAIEVREARQRGVPAPWQKRQTEDWKTVETLHAADRGGLTFQPAVGVHEDVVELDFGSLYPEIIRQRGVSPETVGCTHHEAEPVPELGYACCTEDGFLGEVLGPLLDARAEWKAKLRAGEGPTEELQAKADAVKWVLVACFGYQGYRHAKFGRIEVHEAINAYAREIAMTAKEAAEAAGWRVCHGIVDSLWLTPVPDRETEPVDALAARVSDAVDIDLEVEGRFDWLAFCPRRDASGAALMRYFGRWTDPPPGEGGFKLRGIEARQRSTCEFVAETQRALLRVFDRERTPEAVCDRVAAARRALQAGAVDPLDLVVTQRVSKPADEYQAATRARAALRRAEQLGLPRSPGQSVAYAVVDDDADGVDRVRLAHELDAGTESEAEPDTAFYADRLTRACTSVCSPLGWDEARVRAYLSSERDARLGAYGA